MNISGTTVSATGHKGGLGDGLYDKAGARPDLDLDFARTKSLKDRVSKEDLITFTRSSGTGYGATYVDENGLVKVAPINAVVNSEDLTHETYQLSGDGIFASSGKGTLSANAGTSPDGGIAGAIIGEGSSGRYTIGIRPSGTNSSYLLADNTQYAMSVFVKRLSGDSAERYVTLQVKHYPSWTYDGNSGVFDLETGTRISNPSGDGAANITSGIEDVGDGWYRLYIVSTTGSVTTSAGFYVNHTDSSGETYDQTLTSSQGLLVWGAQAEYGSVPTTYIPTTTQPSGAPRFTHDPVTKESKGLLIEQQATNVWLNSEDVNSWSTVGAPTVDSNSALAPDGTQTADKVTFANITNNWTIRYQGIYTGTYTWSGWIKTADNTTKDIYLSWASPDPNRVHTFTATGEWQRFTAVVTPASANVHIGNHHNLTPSSWNGGEFYIWGVQMEAGSIATSYIPTAGSTVTRSPDLVKIDGDNFGKYRTNKVVDTKSFLHSFQVKSSVKLKRHAAANPVTGEYDAVKVIGGTLTGGDAHIQTTLQAVSDVGAPSRVITDSTRVVFSFYARTDAGQTFAVRPKMGRNNAAALYNNPTITITDTWQRYEYDDNGATISLSKVLFGLQFTEANTTIYTYGWQVEERASTDSTPATPFIPSTDEFDNRQSNATYIDGNGLIRTSYANHLKYSEQLDQAAWVKSSGSSITANNVVAPDGTTTADTWSLDSTRYGFYNNTANSWMSAHSQLLYPFTITDEWVRYSIPFSTESGQTSMRVYPLRTNNNVAFVYQTDITVVPSTDYVFSAWYKKVGTKVYVWGCQLVRGTVAASYYKTTDTISGPPRYSYDSNTLTPTGLYLEPAATNLATDSANLTHLVNRDSTDTQNAGIAPDGTNTAVRLAPNTDYDRHGFERNYNTIHHTSKTYSIFVKADPNGNGRYVQFGSGRSTGGINDHTLSIFDAKTGQITDNIAHPSGGGLISKVESFPNGWYRLTVEISETGNATNWCKIYLTPYPTHAAALAANNNDLTTTQIYGSHKFSVTDTTEHNILVWGHQVESGLGSTSYIPTSGAEANRNADIFTSTATEVLDRANGTKPAFYTKNGLTVFSQFDNRKSVSSRIFEFGTGTTMHVSATMTTQNKLGSYQPNDVVAHLTSSSTPLIDGENKLALRYAPNDLKLFTNGNGGPADGSVFTNPSTKLTLGDWSQVSSPTSHRCIEGTINRLTIWKTPFVNSKLDKLTTAIT